jgi:hypothetical protein
MFPPIEAAQRDACLIAISGYTSRTRKRGWLTRWNGLGARLSVGPGTNASLARSLRTYSEWRWSWLEIAGRVGADDDAHFAQHKQSNPELLVSPTGSDQ